MPNKKIAGKLPQKYTGNAKAIAWYALNPYLATILQPSHPEKNKDVSEHAPNSHPMTEPEPSYAKEAKTVVWYALNSYLTT